MCVCAVGKGESALARQLNKAPGDSPHAGGLTQVMEKQPHGKAQHSSTSGSVMRAMHDSSSSWTDRSLPPRAQATAAPQQADAASLQPPHAQREPEHHEPSCLKPVAPDDCIIEMHAGPVCAGQAAVPAAADAAAAVVTIVPQNGMRFGDLRSF